MGAGWPLKEEAHGSEPSRACAFSSPPGGACVQWDDEVLGGGEKLFFLEHAPAPGKFLQIVNKSNS